MQVGDGALHGPDARAQIKAFEPGGHRHVALQVLTSHFGLAGNLLDCRERAERTGPPVALTSSVFLMASTDARVDSGNRTRMV